MERIFLKALKTPKGGEVKEEAHLLEDFDLHFA